MPCGSLLWHTRGAGCYLPASTLCRLFCPQAAIYKDIIHKYYSPLGRYFTAFSFFRAHSHTCGLFHLFQRTGELHCCLVRSPLVGLSIWLLERNKQKHYITRSDCWSVGQFMATDIATSNENLIIIISLIYRLDKGVSSDTIIISEVGTLLPFLSLQTLSHKSAFLNLKWTFTREHAWTISHPETRTAFK